tara:strand:+ start:2492 stop:2785 length:294 start_codon:yes stop_codon:yes gene_type:complete
MARIKIVNGVQTPLTEAEETATDEREAAWSAGAFDRSILALRNDRNNKLAESDYYALSDVAMSQEMTNYRQSLRDLTAGLTTEDGVKSVVWPVTPGS